MPAEWEPHGATWIAWPHHEPDWPGKLGADPVGVRGDRARARRSRAGRNPLPRRASVEAAAQAALDAHGVRAIACGCTSSRPIASGCATRRRPACIDDDGRRRAGELGVQRLGEVRQLAAGRARRRGDRARSPGCRASSRGGRTRRARSCSKAAASRSTATGLLLVTEEWLLSDVQVRNPGLTRDDYERVVRRVARDAHGRSGSAKDASATTRTGTSTTSPGSSRQTRSCSPSSRIPPTRITPLDRQPAAPRSRRGAGEPPARGRHAALSAARDDEWRAAAGELRELLHRQRRGARADVQRPERPRGAEHARGADADTTRSSASTPSIWCGDSARCTA